MVLNKPIRNPLIHRKAISLYSRMPRGKQSLTAFPAHLDVHFDPVFGFSYLSYCQRMPGFQAVQQRIINPYCQHCLNIIFNE